MVTFLKQFLRAFGIAICLTAGWRVLDLVAAGFGLDVLITNYGDLFYGAVTGALIVIIWTEERELKC